MTTPSCLGALKWRQVSRHESCDFAVDFMDFDCHGGEGGAADCAQFFMLRREDAH